jgi:hypothetical protein
LTIEPSLPSLSKYLIVQPFLELLEYDDIY